MEDKIEDIEPIEGMYAVIPSAVLFDNSISPGCRLLFAALSSLSNMKGYCWASNAYLAKMFGVTIRQIQRRLSELHADFLIDIEEAARKDGSLERRIKIHSKVGKFGHRGMTNTSCGNDQNVTHNNISNNNISNNIKTLRSKSKKANDFNQLSNERFEIIWKEYPHKIGKVKAFEKFKAQVKTDEDFVDITKALGNYKADMEIVRGKHSDRDWMHGKTWFNHCWKDFVDYEAPEIHKEKTWAEKYEEENQ